MRSFGFQTPAGVARDGTILFTGTDEWPFGEVSPLGSATLLRGRRKVSVGPTEAASILPDGTVVGYALRRADGSYCGGLNEPDDAHFEAFRWRDGRRTTLGRFTLLAALPTGVLFGATFEDVRHGANDDPPQSLFTLANGRRREVPLGSEPVRGPYHLRADGSVLFTLGEKDTSATGLGLWSGGATIERIAPRAPKGSLDWVSADVDEKGRIVVKDGDDHRWQVVRR